MVFHLEWRTVESFCPADHRHLDLGHVFILVFLVFTAGQEERAAEPIYPVTIVLDPAGQGAVSGIQPFMVSIMDCWGGLFNAYNTII